MRGLGARPAGGAAARWAGVSRTTAYNWKSAGPALAAQRDEARECKIEKFETTLHRMAMEKDLGAVIFFLKSHRPEIYNRRQLIGIGGDPDAPPIGVVQHSDEERVVFYHPINGRYQPEAEPPTIEGTTEGEAA